MGFALQRRDFLGCLFSSSLDNFTNPFILNLLSCFTNLAAELTFFFRQFFDYASHADLVSAGKFNR
jgi:hypothetical protein